MSKGNAKIKLVKETHDKDIIKVVEEINTLLLQRENIDKRLKYLCDKVGKKNCLMIVE